MKNIICVAGPTASGKTALAVELAKFTNGEVVSCDSMQIYKRMTIGTAKPVPEETDGIVHHMIDICEPDEDFSVSKYCCMATPIVEDILARGKTAIIAGGTGRYMDSLIKGNDFAPFPATGHRERLEEKLAAVGLDNLLAELAAVDPEAAERSQRNPRRVIRALEVFYETGETITAHNLRTQSIPPRFDLRVDIMLQQGLLEEIRELLASGIPADCTAMQAIGYKEFICAMKGTMTVEEAAEDLKQASRRYAKRQLTWFRRNKNIHWLTRTAETAPEEILQKARQLIIETDK